MKAHTGIVLALAMSPLVDGAWASQPPSTRELGSERAIERHPFVGSAPYFHHGRYMTLREAIEAHRGDAAYSLDADVRRGF